MRVPKPFFRAQTQSWYVQLGRRQINLGKDEQAAWDKYHAMIAGRSDLLPSTPAVYLLDRRIRERTFAALKKCLPAGRAVNYTPRFNIVSWVHHPRLVAAQSRVNEEYLNSIRLPTAQESSPAPGEPKDQQLQLGFKLPIVIPIGLSSR